MSNAYHEELSSCRILKIKFLYSSTSLLFHRVRVTLQGAVSVVFGQVDLPATLSVDAATSGS